MKTFFKHNNGFTVVEEWEPHCWINIQEPDEDDKNYLLNDLNVPESFYLDIQDVDERPRIEDDDGWIMVIVRIPYKGNSVAAPYFTIPVGIIFKDDIFITLTFFQTTLLDEFIIHSNHKKISPKGDYDFVLRLLLISSSSFLKHLKQINQDIKAAETKLEKSIRNEDLQMLLQIEKSLVFFATSLSGNDILVYRMKNIKHLNILYDEDLMEDVETELRQAIETTDIYRDILSSTTDAYASVISNNLNVIMKRLTSISIILMLPTLIASLYGMNVPNYLENNPYGFFIAIVFSVVMAIIGVFIFYKRKWF